MAEMRGDWAGIPIPVDDFPLVVEPTFPGAEGLSRFGHTSSEDTDAPEETAEREEFVRGHRIRNIWYSTKRRCDVAMIENIASGRVFARLKPAFHHLTHDVSTLGCVDAWGLEQEDRALALLRSMISDHQAKQYALTGMFLESSPRSGVTYIFRRLRPTVALAARPGLGYKPDQDMTILSSLCMHPIAYYAGSWAGAMVPTDDVVAHLSMMRGDEHLFWKRANQHAPHRPEAGL